MSSPHSNGFQTAQAVSKSSDDSNKAIAMTRNISNRNVVSGQRNDLTCQEDVGADEISVEEITILERKLVRKLDLRLCTIAGILCSLNLLDSGIISSASVTSIFKDLGLGVGNRYVSSLPP
jgi:hypothetical protein